MTNESRPPEFLVNEPEKLVNFYEKVLGWKALAFNKTTGNWTIYARTLSEDGRIEESETKLETKRIYKGSSLLHNFWVPDLMETTQRVIENGGHIYIEAGEENGDIIVLPNIGRQRFFCDPEDNIFGATEPIKAAQKQVFRGV
jgi:predicted enzyme related to lactoylglutathione lyase